MPWLWGFLAVHLAGAVITWLVITRLPVPDEDMYVPASDAEVAVTVMIALLIWPNTAWLLYRSRNVGNAKER